jgi:hypothetical protein
VGDRRQPTPIMSLVALYQEGLLATSLTYFLMLLLRPTGTKREVRGI